MTLSPPNIKTLVVFQCGTREIWQSCPAGKSDYNYIPECEDGMQVCLGVDL